MKRDRVIYTLLGWCFLLYGCQALERKQQVGAVAEVDGRYLYRATLDSLTLGMAEPDSSRVAEAYIHQWAADQLIYAEGKRYAQSEEIEKLVDDYRQTLYVHAYEEYLVDKRMPKEINDSTLELYYNQMSERFRLKESIIKGLLVIVPIDAPKIKDLRKWLTQVPSENLQEEGASNEILDRIEKYAYQNASGYDLFTDKWRTSSEVMAQIPIERAELERQVASRNQIEVADSAKIYLLQITEKQRRGEPMPLEYVRPEIEKIILTGRQVGFLEEERERLYQEAVEEKRVKFY